MDSNLRIGKWPHLPTVVAVDTGIARTPKILPGSACWRYGRAAIFRSLGDKVSDLGLSYVQMLSQSGNRPKRNTSSESVFSSGCSVARPPFLQVAELTRSPHQIMPKVTLHCSPPPAVVWLDFYAVLLWLFARFIAPFRMRFRSG